MPSLYIPVIAHKSGGYIAERDLSACTREQIIRDIYDGQIENVTQIWCIDTERGWVGDVIADIAIDIGNLTLTDCLEPFPALVEWLDKHGADYFEAPDEEDLPDYIEHALSARQLGVGRYA